MAAQPYPELEAIPPAPPRSSTSLASSRSRGSIVPMPEWIARLFSTFPLHTYPPAKAASTSTAASPPTRPVLYVAPHLNRDGTLSQPTDLDTQVHNGTDTSRLHTRVGWSSSDPISLRWQIELLFRHADFEVQFVDPAHNWGPAKSLPFLHLPPSFQPNHLDGRASSSFRATPSLLPATSLPHFLDNHYPHSKVELGEKPSTPWQDAAASREARTWENLLQGRVMAGVLLAVLLSPQSATYLEQTQQPYLSSLLSSQLQNTFLDQQLRRIAALNPAASSNATGIVSSASQPTTRLPGWEVGFSAWVGASRASAASSLASGDLDARGGGDTVGAAFASASVDQDKVIEDAVTSLRAFADRTEATLNQDGSGFLLNATRPTSLDALAFACVHTVLSLAATPQAQQQSSGNQALVQLKQVLDESPWLVNWSRSIWKTYVKTNSSVRAAMMKSLLCSYYHTYTLDRVTPPPDRHPAPLDHDRGMVTLFLCKLGDGAGKSVCRCVVLEFVRAPRLGLDQDLLQDHYVRKNRSCNKSMNPHSGLELSAAVLRLREAKLAPDTRHAALETLRTLTDSEITRDLTARPSGVGADDQHTGSLHTIIDIVEHGPNDARRVVFQCLSQTVEQQAQTGDRESQAFSHSAASALFGAIIGYLRATLRLQQSRALLSGLGALSASVDLSLPVSSLRALASALKALHSLLPLVSESETGSALNASIPTRALASRLPVEAIVEIILPCLALGLQHLLARQSTASPRTFPISLPNAATALTHVIHGASAIGLESATGISCASETEGKSARSDHSESEQSDVSAHSFRTTSSRASRRGNDTRQQDAATKAIRQNSLHLLIRLNQRFARSMYPFWNRLLPETPPSSLPNLSASGSTSTFSLFSLISQDPSSSVRIAAVHALDCILSKGSQHLGIALQRPGTSLTFTSLSSRVAVWVVNIRLHLLNELQKAQATTNKSTSSSSERIDTRTPSELLLALLQATRNFVASTAKAKLLDSNSQVIEPVVSPFLSYGDPRVRVAAGAVVAALQPSRVPLKVQIVPRNIESGEVSSQLLGTPNKAHGQDATSRYVPGSSVSSAEPLSARNAETLQPARQHEMLGSLSSIEAMPFSDVQATTFVAFLRSFDREKLDANTSHRVWAVWKTLEGKTLSKETRCSLIDCAPDLIAGLDTESAQTVEIADQVIKLLTLATIEGEEVMRAAAIRAFGLLVLPSQAQTQPDSLLDESAHLSQILFGSRDHSGALWDTSSLVRQRAMWCLANWLEAYLRTARDVISLHSDISWSQCVIACLEAARDQEGVAISAYRAFGVLLAMFKAPLSRRQQKQDQAPEQNPEARDLASQMLTVLCNVMDTSSKPPKSRWNAASALERAVSSQYLMQTILSPLESTTRSPAGHGDLLDRVIATLCSGLAGRMFKIKICSCRALLMLAVGAVEEEKANEDWQHARRQLLGDARRKRVLDAATLAADLLDSGVSAVNVKEAALYSDELRELLQRLRAACS
ncbi:hypothetical protein BCV70DRAFT_164952 [Testicularia cyperi]|uniref:DUF4042 domain-containing protein n=1 Tax=Testicularia cyperi TaxID=1882483 RepID=A0A317XJT2_9BASI|nr:hypothetical protein BCV70DRAFT_164952 [Testicularia cyperi]